MSGIYQCTGFCFNETIINIMSNFVPNELSTCDNRVSWMNHHIKNLIVAINGLQRQY